MQRPFETRRATDDNAKSSSERSENPTIKLERLRAKHGVRDESKNEPNVFELQSRKQQQELREKATGGWEPKHSDFKKSRPPLTLKGGMEGSSVSGTTDMTRGIHVNDLQNARDYIVRNYRTEDFLPHRGEFNDIVLKCDRGEAVKDTLVKWQNGSDAIKKAFANKTLEEADTRRAQNWNNDD